jgi:hypothetical protein
MERFGLDADRAFAVLRRYSQDHNIKLREVARRTVETRTRPPADGGERQPEPFDTQQRGHWCSTARRIDPGAPAGPGPGVVKTCAGADPTQGWSPAPVTGVAEFDDDPET